MSNPSFYMFGFFLFGKIVGPSVFILSLFISCFIIVVLHPLLLWHSSLFLILFVSMHFRSKSSSNWHISLIYITLYTEKLYSVNSIFLLHASDWISCGVYNLPPTEYEGSGQVGKTMFEACPVITSLTNGMAINPISCVDGQLVYTTFNYIGKSGAGAWSSESPRSVNKSCRQRFHKNLP